MSIDDRPDNPRGFDAMLRAAFNAGGAYAADLIGSRHVAPGVPATADEAFAEWRASLLPDRALVDDAPCQHPRVTDDTPVDQRYPPARTCPDCGEALPASEDDVDWAPCCPLNCAGPCTFPGYADNH